MTALVEAPRVDPDLLADIKRFGAADVSACFSCGNCSAICPLSNNDGTFPRRMIRYGQVGLRDELLSSKELWACYHCGLCSESCPQRADPGEYMAAARRYAIASYDRTGIARTLYTHPALGSGLLVVLAAAFATFFSVKSGTQPRGSLQLFSFLPDAVVHWTGIAVMIAVVLAALTGVATMVHGLARREGVHGRDLVVGAASWRRAWRGAWNAVAVESLGQKRFRDDCAHADPSEHWYERRWIIHATVMWGFIGLLVATM
ncbi:MAG: 4Fe-4S dicluster domain-containing protein, partial [Actinomycetales bacterium]|nr:4Fe-4S dicluster domain-containing protein [Actinomycetales bacterium]